MLGVEIDAHVTASLRRQIKHLHVDRQTVIEGAVVGVEGSRDRFIDEAYSTATRILNEGRDKVELIAKALLEFETLDANHLRDIIDFGEMRDPPSAPKPPPVPDELKNKPVPKPTEEDRPEGPGTLR